MSSYQGIKKIRQAQDAQAGKADEPRLVRNPVRPADFIFKLNFGKQQPPSRIQKGISERRPKPSNYVSAHDPSIQNFILSGSARERPSISHQGGTQPLKAREPEEGFVMQLGPTMRSYASRSKRDSFDREALSRQDPRKLGQGQQVSKGLFAFQFVVGKGGFGKVWKVVYKKNGKVLAMKEMLKAKIIEKKSVRSVMNERELVARLFHPFIINMTYAFQDRDTLYLALDYVNGGDLRYHVGRMRRFRESQTKFFIACLLVALEYLHTNNIIHRDIKPENLVLDDRGYLRLTDLGISREYRPDNASDTSGTPGYMAPEVICKQNHSFEVDFFAVGVIGYEFMLGRRPYVGKNRKEIREQILAKQVQVKPEEVPKGWSLEAMDFVNQLLQRKPSSRLGFNGIDEVKDHPWVRDFQWNRLIRKELESPYLPTALEENYDDYKDQISEDSLIENPEECALMLRNPEVQRLFEGYYFDRTQRRNTKGWYASTDSTEEDGKPSGKGAVVGLKTKSFKR